MVGNPVYAFLKREEDKDSKVLKIIMIKKISKIFAPRTVSKTKYFISKKEQKIYSVMILYMCG